MAWLRQILVRSLANQVKHHRRQARDQQRQESLDSPARAVEPDGPAMALAAHRPLAQRSGQPSRAGRAAGRRRRTGCPPDYREAFVLRTLEHVPFEEIAVRMGRSTGAVRMLWARAVKQLNQMLAEER